jgi:hypothetical protein
MLDAAIRRRAVSLSFGEQLAAEGVATVALAADGSMVESRPDGSTRVVTTATSSD